MSSANNNNSIRCASFKPQQLRPDKCKNCFADKSRHQQQESPLEDSLQQASKDEPPSATSATGAVNGPAKSEEEKDKLIERYEKEIAKLKDELKAAQRGDCQQCQTSKSQLGSLESKCRSLECERDKLKEELKALEREMEEMHDTFKEEESEQFEQTKQELDLALKNCKILQIRLHKAERQYGQLEQVKSMLEQQLEETNNRLQAAGHQQQQESTQSINFTQIGSDSVKLSTVEYDKLLKDLSDTFEREKDLQEQMKYSQEEAQLKSDRLQSAEAENEILLNKVSKLTLANSRLRASFHHPVQHQQLQSGDDSLLTTVSDLREATEERTELIQENGQLKLALEFAQSECDRSKGKLQEAQSKLDSLKNALQSSESKRVEFESELNRLKLRRQSSFEVAGGGSGSGSNDEDPKVAELRSRLELECRQLRSKLVQSERENRQLKVQSMSSSSNSSSSAATTNHGQQRQSTFMSVRGMSVPKSHSMDMDRPPSVTNGSEQARYREINRQLREQCDSLREQNESLEQRLEDLTLNLSHTAGGQSSMESDLLEKLKRRLDFSESELAKVRSRLVEMDLECSRVQRQHRRLVESLENSNSDSSGMIQKRKVKLPPESMRDSMSRQELRQAVRDMEEELDECFALLRAKDCLITERASEASQPQQVPASVSTCEEQLKSLRRLLEQERLLSTNLKIDVSNLEETKQELMSNTMMLERERVAMEEELDKLRGLEMEMNGDNEELKRINRGNANKLRDLQVSYERARADILKLQQQQQRQKRESSSSPASPGGGSPSAEGNDMLLAARDLSELKVKNGFLMRQLEIAREENARQMDDLKQAHEIQQRRVVEMAQIELRERHLTESQQLRDELNELKQKLAASQRQLTRQEEEMAGERDRLRSQERDWRREKSQLQQKIEQMEAQLSLERRSNEFRVKEIESSVREKERDLINLQDKCVQLERDLKRTQNKYSLLEENSESKQKSLGKDLEAKKRELSDLIATNHSREEEYFEQGKRFKSEKSTLTEALESLRRSYDEKLAELKSCRDLLALRQEQSYKERLAGQEKLDELSGQLVKMSEFKTQARLMEQQLQAQERQVDCLRRDCMQLKEDKLRLKTRCDDSEARCARYEKQERITKTSSISSSSSTNLFARAKSSLSSSKSDLSNKKYSSRAAQQPTNEMDEQQQTGGNNQMIERLTSKINDQRHLISMLKEQNDSAQLELKQMKLVQSGERQKWQNLASQLQSRLNECEEKLLFETSLTNQATFDSCRRKFELKWSEERKNTLDIIQQQQAQNDILMKDFWKLSQQHDLLRLHAKQLETNNQKLSKKLIEYQNQQHQQQYRKPFNLEPIDQQRKLSDCLADKENLLKHQSELDQLNASLLSLLRDQVRPLVETVNKIMAAIESTSVDQRQGTSVDEPTATTAANRRQTVYTNSSGFSSRRESADEGSKSTLRPLVTSKHQMLADADTNNGNQRDLNNVSTSPPAHQMHQQQQQQHQSRLARLFTSKSPSPVDPASQEAKQPSTATTSKVVKKVRVKSAALGITPSEKRQLKERLGELSKAIEDLSSQSTKQQSSRRPFVGGQGKSGARLLNLDHSNVDADSSTSTTTQSRVHWQLNESDSESERSWSLQAPDANRPATNLYRRFPQTSPSSHHRNQQASLTDYESESSLAGSELSLSQRVGAPNLHSLAGVESDSCVGSSSSAGGLRLKSAGPTSSTARRRGLKMRFTDTLRNISRSITGLASDSESESGPANSTSLRLKRKDAKSMSTPTSTSGSVTTSTPKQSGENLKEIRV